MSNLWLVYFFVQELVHFIFYELAAAFWWPTTLALDVTPHDLPSMPRNFLNKYQLLILIQASCSDTIVELDHEVA